MRENIKKFIKNNKWLKVVPNTLTVCNSICGFAAIINIFDAYNIYINNEKVFITSACMILCAMIFDTLDGFTARIFNAGSLKGIQMDSLADMVTFGVAPAVLVAVMANKYLITISGYYVSLLFCVIYLAAVAHRLAKYNLLTMIEKKSNNLFYGLPAPGGAAAICSLVFFFSNSNIDPKHIFVKIIPFYAGFIALLMVSNIKYQNMGKWLINLKRNKIQLWYCIFTIIFIFLFPPLSILIIVNTYLLWGIIREFFISSNNYYLK